MRSSHLLQDLNEESNLDLGCLLEERIECGGSLRFAQNEEPLLDSLKFIFKVLVQSGRCHLLEGIFVGLEVVDPLAGSLVEGFLVSVLGGDLRRI